MVPKYLLVEICPLVETGVEPFFFFYDENGCTHEINVENV